MIAKSKRPWIARDTRDLLDPEGVRPHRAIVNVFNSGDLVTDTTVLLEGEIVLESGYDSVEVA